MWHADKQRGRPLPKGLQSLYQKGNLLQGIVWKWLSIWNCARGAHRLEEWCPCFQPKGMQVEQLCSNAEGACERRGVLEDECYLDGQSLRWHLAGEIQEAAGLPWCRAWETLKWESHIWGFYPNGCHLLESLLGSCLRGRFRGPTGRFCFCTVSSGQKTCILKGSQVTVLEKDPQSTLQQLQCDRWNPGREYLKRSGLGAAWWDTCVREEREEPAERSGVRWNWGNRLVTQETRQRIE